MRARVPSPGLFYLREKPMENYTDVLEQAMQWAIANRPESSVQHKAALANSVAYLVTGASGGYGGPSIREHAVSWALAGDGYNVSADTNLGALTVQFPDGRIPRPGQWGFNAAVQFADPICFGILPASAEQIIQAEHCFDDDPADLQEVERRKKQ